MRVDGRIGLNTYREGERCRLSFPLFLILVLLQVLPLSLRAEDGGGAGAVEEVLALIEEEAERELVAERLERLLIKPLDLNTATAEELSELPFLDDFAFRNILLYRSRHAGFRTIYELKNVQGVPFDRLPLLGSFLTAGPSPYASTSVPEPARHDILLGSSVPIGSGQPSPSLLLRYEGRDKAWQWHLSAEKDKGEPWLPIPKGGFDFLTASLFYKGEKWEAVLGDYRLTTGQGLLLGQSLSYFSSIEYSGTASALSKGLRPHRSFREMGFLRGLSVKGSFLGGFSLTAFAGYEPVDARLEGASLRTLYATGLHREPNERLFRHTARREAAGGYLAYDRGGSLHLGVTAMAFRYKRTSDGVTLLPAERYGRAETTVLASADFRYMAKRWMVFAESLLTGRKEALAVQGGASYKSELYGNITLQARYYGRENYTPYGRPDGYSSTGRNERGIRLIWTGEVARWTTGTLYYDRFRSLDPGSMASNVLTARVSYLLDGDLFTAYARYIARQGSPERWTLTLRGQKKAGSRFTLYAEPRLSGTKGEPVSFALSARTRYAKEPFVGDLSLQYFDLKGRTVMRGYSSYMPLMYGSQMLRNGGWFFSGGLRYAVTEALRLNLRASHLYYTKGTLPGSTLAEVSLTLKI